MMLAEDQWPSLLKALPATHVVNCTQLRTSGHTRGRNAQRYRPVEPYRRELRDRVLGAKLFCFSIATGPGTGTSSRCMCVASGCKL